MCRPTSLSSAKQRPNGPWIYRTGALIRRDQTVRFAYVTIPDSTMFERQGKQHCDREDRPVECERAVTGTEPTHSTLTYCIIVRTMSLHRSFGRGAGLHKAMNREIINKRSSILFGSNCLSKFWSIRGNGCILEWRRLPLTKAGLRYWPFRAHWFESFRPTRVVCCGVNTLHIVLLFIFVQGVVFTEQW
jgi:hypothetical protein